MRNDTGKAFILLTFVMRILEARSTESQNARKEQQGRGLTREIVLVGASGSRQNAEYSDRKLSRSSASYVQNRFNVAVPLSSSHYRELCGIGTPSCDAENPR